MTALAGIPVFLNLAKVIGLNYPGFILEGALWLTELFNNDTN